MKEVAGEAKKRRIWPKSTQFGEEEKKSHQGEETQAMVSRGRKLLNGILQEGAGLKVAEVTPVWR